MKMEEFNIYNKKQKINTRNKRFTYKHKRNNKM